MVDEILASLHKQSGTSFYSNTHQLIIDREKLLISPLSQACDEIFYLHGEGEMSMDFGQQMKLKFTEREAFKGEKNIAYVDAELLIFPLVMRYRQDGDKFMPLGMKSLKKLSNFFVDEKVPLPEKAKVPLLINGNGEMIWVAGLRQDERYKVGATTKKVAIFELSN